MARGTHRQSGRHGKKRSRAFPLLLSMVLLLTLAAGGTLAYLAVRSAQAENQFTAGSVTSSVTGDGRVTNNGNVDAYIRAAVVVNWMDSAGNVSGIKPVSTQSANDGWVKIGEYYYYANRVAPGGTTVTAPALVSVSGNAPSNAYSVSVETVAEAIQADGWTDVGETPAYTDAWGISVLGN